MKQVINLFFIILFGYIIFVAYVYFTQRQMTYFPTQYSTFPQSIKNLGAKNVNLSTEDGLSLNAIYLPVKDNNPLVIHFTGNAAYLGAISPTLEQLAMRGYGFLHVAYRGYSNNRGTPTEHGLYLDAQAALAFVREQGINDDKIIVLGESIGAAVAIDLATRFKPKALVLQSPFTSLPDVAAYHYPFLPVRTLMKEHYDSITKIRRNTAPVLIIHGNSDAIIPIEMGTAMFQAARRPKLMHTLDDKNHNDSIEYSQIILDFLKYIEKINENDQ